MLPRRATLSILLLLCLMPVFGHSAGGVEKTVVRYGVYSKGFNIGDVTTTQRSYEDAGVPSVHFETRTAVKASFLWMGYSLDTTEKGALQKGNLVSYSRKGRENGESIDVEGRFDKSSFHFDVREHAATRSIVIPRNSYDYTTMECPEAQLDFSDKKQITLRILDVEKMEVVKREYRFVENTAYAIGEKKFPCRIIDFSDQNKKARRWIAWDGSAVVMYRQDSKGIKNSYSVQATSATKEM
jgi:hypothetical protein